MKSSVILKTIMVCLFTSSKTVGLQNLYSSSINLTLSRLRRQSNNSGDSCTLPAHPENGRWSIRNGKGEPGEKISINSILEFTCNIGYKLTSTRYLFCIGNGKWSSADIPECEKLCSPIHPTSTTITKCVDKRGMENSCSEPTEGTYLSYKCIDFYEAPARYRRNLICIEGSWNYPMPVCQPVCGKKDNSSATPLIYGGNVTQVIEYPWLAVLYQKRGEQYENICGGTIITSNAVLTVAHCVSNSYGAAFPKENYLVAAAKLFNKYNDNRDPNAQYLNISRIIIHPNYKGAIRRYVGDLAILVTKKQFVLNEFVQPVCFSDVNNMYIYPSSVGVVSGYGRTEDGLPSDQLRTLEIPFKDQTTCVRELPRDWADKYSLTDKICAGIYNKSTSLCKGDSGNGLIYKNPEDNRYYIHGLVSLGHNQDGECNIQQNALYTRVASYYEFVDRQINKYQVKDCSLPPYPEHGKWIIENEDRKPQEIVPSYTLLEFICQQGYRLSLPTATIECGSISITPIGNVSTCEYVGSDTSWKDDDVDKDDIGNDASWEDDYVNELVCGKKVRDDVTPLIYQGKVNKAIEYPWISIIYRKEGGQYINICGGSIISKKLVLTAAHCVTNMHGDAFSPENYTVAAGKLHSRYSDSRDTTAQYLNVQRLIVHPNYRADNRSFLADIAIIVVKEPFHLNKFIQPVCFRNVKNINIHIGSIGVVGGFGAEENGRPSDELKTLEIPYKPENICVEELPGDWKDRYYTIDKLCAGYFNKSMGICDGDGGNGLVFRNPENDRYYVHGVASLVPKIKHPNSTLSVCDVQQNSLYTRVAFHYDFINSEIIRYKNYVKNCTLPSYPDNGKWVTRTGDKKPGDIVPSNTLLRIICNDGYKLSFASKYQVIIPDISQVKCGSSSNMPTCQSVLHQK